MYVVFNPNLITLAQLHEKKFFQDLIKKFLKVLKKSTNGNFDSSFMLGILIQIKDLDLINTKNKFISLISTNSNNTYLDNNKGKNKVSIFNQISDDFNSRISEFNFESYNQTKNSVCELAMDIIKLNYDTKIKYENVKPLIPIIFYTKEYINKNNSSINLNNLNLFNMFNSNNNFTFLNGMNIEANNPNATNSHIFGQLDDQDDESKGKNIYNENTMINNRLTLENFVKKNPKANNNFSINDKISMFDKNRLNNEEEEEFKKEKNAGNKNLKKKVKSEIEKENQSDKQEDIDQDIGNFDLQEKPNKKTDKYKQKTKVKIAPLKLYVDDESHRLNLENVFLFLL